MSWSKMNQGMVSVIVPAYNVEHTIERCVDSVINQTYNNLEIIIVNDGSKDNTYQKMEELVKRDSRVRIFSQQNKGLSGARNTGIDNMVGEYVMFLDGDDFIHPSMVEILMKNSKEYDADYVSSNFVYYYGDEIKYAKLSGNGKLIGFEGAIDYLVSDIGYCSACAKLYCSELWENLRYPEDVRYSEDMFLAHKLIDRAKTIVHVPEGVYYYSQDTTSLTRSDFNIQKLHMIEGACEWVEFCKEKNSIHTEKAEAYCCRVITHYLSKFAKSDNWDLYKKYQKVLRNEFNASINNKFLTMVDKIKLIVVCCISGRVYKFIRKVTRK